MVEPPTRVALLTSEGRGAIAVVAVEGPQAAGAAARHFIPAGGIPLGRSPLGRIVFGRWGGETGEEIVAVRMAPDQVELHCHGGLAAAAAILADLVGGGCLTESWQHRALRRLGPFGAAAEVALSQARTERAAGILLDQYHGALETALREVVDLLAVDRSAAIARLEELLRRSRLGLHLTRPWRVVLAGSPNVGKSCLLNALVGYRRAVVFDQPGTTRDVVRAATAIGGWPVELADTAGLRTGGDELEAAGVAKACVQVAESDLILLVFDASAAWSSVDAALLAAHPAALPVHNKCDLAMRSYARPTGYPASALRGDGIERLLGAIALHLVPEVPPIGAAVPFNDEHVSTIETALASARKGAAAAAAASIAAMLG